MSKRVKYVVFTVLVGLSLGLSLNAWFMDGPVVNIGLSAMALTSGCLVMVLPTKDGE